MTKLFLVEITSDQRTRWSQTEREFSATLCVLASGAAKIWTHGSEPEVSVTLLGEDQLVVDREALKVLQRKAGLRQ